MHDPDFASCNFPSVMVFDLFSVCFVHDSIGAKLIFCLRSQYMQIEMTALIYATASGHSDCVHLLLEAGAGKDIKDEGGRTALFWAARNGHADCLRLLLNAGADSNVKIEVRVIRYVMYVPILY